MSVFASYTRKNFIKNKVRTIVSLIGIMLSIGLLTAVFTTVTSVLHFQQELTIKRSGSWEIGSLLTSDEAVAQLKENSDVIAAIQYKEIGSTQFKTSFSSSEMMLAVNSMPQPLKGDAQATQDIIALPDLIEGAWPKAAHEIVLPEALKGETVEGGFKSDGPIGLGSQITLDLGTRRVAPGQNFAGTPITVGTPRLVSTEDTGQITEVLDHVQAYTYKVVGFAPTQAYLPSLMFEAETANSVRLMPAVCYGEDAPVAALVTFARTKRMSQPADYKKLADKIYKTEADGSSYAELSYPRAVGNDTFVHHNLLQDMGIVDRNLGIWDTLWNFALILGVIISIASISLIYNAFAISVAERTREFGLLSSLGASKLQLMRTIGLEAGFLGLVGIPGGIALGILGVFVVFNLLSHIMIELFGGTIELWIEWPVILYVAGASVLIILISATLPAVRAARVSAVEAIRSTQDVKLTRSAQRKMAKLAAYLESAFTVLDKAYRRGIPRFLSARNLTRSHARGRIISISIALSFTLFVVAGTFAAYMDQMWQSTLTGRLSHMDTDVVINISLLNSDLAKQDSVLTSKTASMLERRAAALKDTELLAHSYTGYGSLIVPKDIIQPDVLEDVRHRAAVVGSEAATQKFENKDSIILQRSFAYVDDALWKDICQAAGVVPVLDKPQMFAVNAYQNDVENDDRYRLAVEAFKKKGQIEFGAVQGALNANSCVVDFNKDGKIEIVEYDTDGKPQPATDARFVSRNLSIDAFISQDVLKPYRLYLAENLFPQVVMNSKAAEYLKGCYEPEREILSYKTANSTEFIKQVQGNMSEHQDDGWVSFEDVKAQVRRARMTNLIVNVFNGLFVGILISVAIANIFNTLTNSMLLRRREFAVLKSIGMDNRTFASMLFWECASYAIKGLVAGMILSGMASALLYGALTSSIGNPDFIIPWIYVAIATVAVAAVLAFSVLFALHKARTNNIIESLRMD